jgi:hypothetical protein
VTSIGVRNIQSMAGALNPPDTPAERATNEVSTRAIRWATFEKATPARSMTSSPDRITAADSVSHPSTGPSMSTKNSTR